MKHLTAQKHSSSLGVLVEKTLQATPVYDIHTHLYPPAFGGLLLWGLDDLLTYHYLIAESFRYWDVPYEKFWALPKARQAEMVWETLFLRNSPISEACRGVLTTLQALGLDVRKRDLNRLRQWFAEWRVEDYVSHCMELGGVQRICMTNSPFDDVERRVWEGGFTSDPRFTAALRIDPLVLNWPETSARLREWGYTTNSALSDANITGVRRYLSEWTRRMQPRYLMVSLPPDFAFPSQMDSAHIVERAVLPHCREFGLPFALMPGVKRAVNPALGLAGDGEGLTQLDALINLCAQYPDNKFLATVLARENQHELCVLARKFRNLHIFGCWWFTNVPYVINEMTRMRLELLGLSFTPQHSDARVLDQLIYKWRHSRKIIAQVLVDKYADLAQTGWEPSPADIQRDVQNLFGGDFERFCRS